MTAVTRRGFLSASAAAATAGLFAPLGRAVSVSNQVSLDPNLTDLVRLIRATLRDKCVPVFVKQLQAGLSYHDFLAALFVASFGANDLHQVLQIYSAHRLASEARPEERLLPLFWALDRIKLGHEDGQGEQPPEALKGGLPAAGRAAAVFQEAMAKSDPDQAERAIVALARNEGARRAMARLWEYGARDVSGTLGHHPITVANAWRALEVVGWQHAEPVLRYVTGYFGGFEGDGTYAANSERVKRTLPGLPADWAGGEPSRGATLEIYRSLRQGATDATCDLVCAQLSSGRVKAGAVWDAVHLVAADLLFRYKTGGAVLGGGVIHAVTSTEALRFGFECSGDDRARLLMTLQAVGALGHAFVGEAMKDGLLRDMDLLDLKVGGDGPSADVAGVFSLLPYKANDHQQTDPRERQASDEACRRAFALVRDPRNARRFEQTARSFLCAKASADAHDVKGPVAAFEAADRVNPEWRPYLLVASVHVLHGPKSRDTRALVQAREALRE